ncbi:mucin-6 [Callorhinchus milii]|uniref:mucin-6 n=1 Tax=Callorhinchus milii TaxID=7868 RepID=UPI00045733E3|nr:mucin-6 [Callorhinchus milii]|eukprot:gi/632984660/ref/XP_007909249.1/ PREDICTED: mucin-6-like [Callorhinchus milii]
MSEYARECSRMLQTIYNWRRNDLCSPAKCPTNQIYLECGSPCYATCSNLRTTCDSHGTYGCFCPEGTVLDDISKEDLCVPLEQCPCIWNEEIYHPGERRNGLCRTCVCSMGQWNCTNLSCPGTCSVEGGSFFTTFDSRSYRLYGACTYVLVKSSMLPEHGHIEGVFARCGVKPTEICVKAIVYTNNKVKITFLKGGLVYVDNKFRGLPYVTGDIRIHRKSAKYVQMSTQFGLKMEILVHPILQLYITVQITFFGTADGLCGNFNGDAEDDFRSCMEISEGTSAIFVNSWQVGGHCASATEQTIDPCSLSHFKSAYAQQHCYILLNKTSIFGRCHGFVGPMEYYERCRYETCNYESIQDFLCSALESYVQACKLRGIVLEDWMRHVDACEANYRDMVNGESCEQQHLCPCVMNGNIYASGEKEDTLCKSCVCTVGQWNCTSEPCLGTCSVEGGSYVTSFDLKRYRFHGLCTYLLFKSAQNPKAGHIAATFYACGETSTEICLKTLIYTINKVKIEISRQDTIKVNDEIKLLPYKTGAITIYRQSSMYIQLSTSYGLEMQIQIQPVTQVYINIDSSFFGTTFGLCGNFNGESKDDFMSSTGILEHTPAPFVDSWHLDRHCAPVIDTQPCKSSLSNWGYPPTLCYLLLDTTSIFGRGHHLVDPLPYEEKCRYETCNYKTNPDFLCSALGSYAHACAAKKLILTNWRNSARRCKITCPGKQIFSYNAKACERTCMSLSDRDFEFTATDVPVEGCVCPLGLYLDTYGRCVKATQCSCILSNGKVLAPGKTTVINGQSCCCREGKVKCSGQFTDYKGLCNPQKVYFNCAYGAQDQFGTSCAQTCQMIAMNVSCTPTECVSGCICLEGTVLDENDTCVHPNNCSCKFRSEIYKRGEKMIKDCQKCVCLRGKWKCEEKVSCPATCAIHGDGHLTTFDGKSFTFDGNCEYTLVQDSCCANSTRPSFKVVTENMICSSRSGATCSREIKIYIGDVLIQMTDGTYKVTPETQTNSFHISVNPMYLSFEATISGSHILSILWNKNTNAFIQITRQSQLSVCGLCGNFNGDIRDDFLTRNMYIAADPLEFANTWKEEPTCQDVTVIIDPCDLSPARLAWAQKQCAVINSAIFNSCHKVVFQLPYYKKCIRDACGCEVFGDCDCLCGAVAVYAKACLDKGICIDWRTISFCPIYCEYFNNHDDHYNDEFRAVQTGNCSWHYQPCICPANVWSFPKSNMEGCYKCPVHQYYDEEQQLCVACE